MGHASASVWILNALFTEDNPDLDPINLAANLRPFRGSMNPTFEVRNKNPRFYGQNSRFYENFNTFECGT